VGLIEGRPAAIVHDPANPDGPATGLILIVWDGDRIVELRDFYHARYVLEAAAISAIDPVPI